LAAPGAAIGYCQALFGFQRNPAEHTNFVTSQLMRMDAPWRYSHELFWGYHGKWTAEQYLTAAMKPLIGLGRVPILITGLNPACHKQEIRDIIATTPPLVKGEPLLIRLLLSSKESVIAAAALTAELFERATATHSMPTWWPLFQGNLPEELWLTLKSKLGSLWQYVNIAINPFMSLACLDVVWEQITVAQIPIGLASGIKEEGMVFLEQGTKITGAGENPHYSFLAFIENIKRLRTAPTLIILGPSAPDWPEEWNVLRLQAFLPILRQGIAVLWQPLGATRLESLLKLSA